MAPVFSPDSGHIFYMLQDYKNSKSIAFVNDTKTGEVKSAATYDHIGVFALSPDGVKFAYAAGKENKYFVVLSSFEKQGAIEKEAPVHGMISGLVFSPDNGHIAYVAANEGKSLLIITDWRMSAHKQSERYDNISSIKFSSDGKSVLYAIPSGEGVLWKALEVE